MTSIDAPVPSPSTAASSAQAAPVAAAVPGRQVRTLVILGVAGDLSKRLLLPGIASLLADGNTEPLALVGFAAPEHTEEAFRARLAETLGARIEGAREAGAAALRATIDGARLITGDATDPATLASLSALDPGHTALFFALPPAVTQKGLEALAPGQLAEGTVLVLEKPFGHDAASAAHLNAALTRLVPESSIFRVDHFLAKSTVLNIAGLRFANRFIEPLLNADNVECVDIVYNEDLALEGRAGYYDTAGALRDMIQSHLLQIAAFLLMDQPSTLTERDLRDRVGEVLRALEIDGSFQEATWRARYTAGEIGARDIPDYAAEPGVDPARKTETMAQIRLRLKNSRWAGVPVTIRSGKAVGEVRKEIVVTFKPVPYLPEGFSGIDSPTRLRIGLGPETLKLEIDVNGPGNPFQLDRVALSTALSSSRVLPYGEVISSVLEGDLTLSVRGDAAEECWRIVDPVLEAWARDEVPLDEYAAGTEGPASWPVATADDGTGLPRA
ncbi:glucose-6-phosphate dehydrogenase [Galactobacter valiniphilus]|uniref:glucose-6-phosphate dehydrogenase n=1 Tax=Galactobacter valiniphilus TaxID=2676122 RepID=UPI001F385ECB|nr:glucose-6-phosphate dehydrogenase [Galactobacter valiniphilus]